MKEVGFDMEDKMVLARTTLVRDSVSDRRDVANSNNA